MTRTWKNATVVDMQACGSAEETHVDAMTWSTVIEGVPMTMTELYSDPNKTAKSSVTLVQSTMESPFGPLVCTLCRGSGSEAALAASKGKSCFNTIISNAAAKSPHYAACSVVLARSLTTCCLLNTNINLDIDIYIYAADKVLASASPLPEIVYSVAVPLPGAIPGMGWPG